MAAQAQTPPVTADGFAVPQPGYRFEFPRDHGSHPDFKIEWWYLTGHLFAGDGRRFGFQATFFRQAGPRRTSEAASKNFGDAHLHLAHMALVDVKTGRFIHQERLNRDGWDAAAAEGKLEVRNGPWRLEMTDTAAQAMELQGSVGAEASFRLTLAPAKPLVIFGENGVSRKGAEPTAASYYLTFSRLRASGELTFGGETFRVRGEAWMDHEISSSQLGREQIGWDWVSVQLKDGRELMLYRLRLRGGGADPASTLTWVLADGTARRAGFSWEVLTRWTSPETGASYPAKVQLTTRDPLSGEPAVFVVEPLAAGQELGGKLGGVSYWEGACRVRDEAGNEIGSAYMELTGYAKELKL